jgi:DnaK suppressor protein
MSVPTAPSSTLTREHLAALYGQLSELKAFREQQLRELEQAEPTSDSTEQEITEALLVAARTALRDVESALARMAHGAYGRCVDCGEPMPLVRLEVLPQVARCMGCQQEAESA